MGNYCTAVNKRKTPRPWYKIQKIQYKHPVYWLIVSLLFRSSRVRFTYIWRRRLLPKANFTTRPMLDSQSHKAVRLFLGATPTVIRDIRFIVIVEDHYHYHQLSRVWQWNCRLWFSRSVTAGVRTRDSYPLLHAYPTYFERTSKKGKHNNNWWKLGVAD